MQMNVRSSMCARYVVSAGSGEMVRTCAREGLGSREGLGEREDARLGASEDGRKVPDSRGGRRYNRIVGIVRRIVSHPGESAKMVTERRRGSMRRHASVVN